MCNSMVRLRKRSEDCAFNFNPATATLGSHRALVLDFHHWHLDILISCNCRREISGMSLGEQFRCCVHRAFILCCFMELKGERDTTDNCF